MGARAIQVTTSLGKVRGTTHGPVSVFRALPFAQPPVGPLRFAPPQPPTRWTGVRDGTQFGPASYQAKSPMAAVLGFDIAAESEDCLTLNVWTPGLTGQRPVMVWLHGGAWVIGSGSQSAYNGTRLAARGDVVVVTVNYRLGLLGYLRTVEASGEALPATGNEALLDCIAALQWVRREIGAFGGDPANVTLFGESAGAVNTAALLTAPGAKGLFDRAILQSGALNLLQPREAAEAVGRKVLAQLAIEPGEGGRLRDLPVEALREAQEIATPRTAGVSYAPVADGGVIPQSPHDALANGSSAGVPVLVGTNLDEMKLYRFGDPAVETLTAEGLLARVERLSPGRDIEAGEIVRRYTEARAERGQATDATSLWFAISTDWTFRWGAMHLAEVQARHAAVYAYLFTRQSPAFDGQLGAGHATDLPFVFGCLDDPGFGPIAGSGPDVERLSATMQDAWLAFARTGDPSTKGLRWPRYDAKERKTMLLGDNCEAVSAPYEAERACWDAPPPLA